ncbi:uncharacterized protein B4U79_19142 [Dinothrombium tinctorium]|uniref:CCHC-type domain-containing protein n=1 Tax=Dinothrombium tinctorium TaxID=1965070 RepID=A0A3S3PJ60_9ACAR|nr:uncharacterized protein B4U79_19142 [Dinothrombium tinctorium]
MAASTQDICLISYEDMFLQLKTTIMDTIKTGKGGMSADKKEEIGLSDEELKESIIEQNIDIMKAVKYQDDIKIIKRILPKTESEVCDCIIEVSAAIYQVLQKIERVNIGWLRCRFINHVPIIQCNKCLAYGHFAKDCRCKEHHCAYCGEAGHKISNCHQKEANNPTEYITSSPQSIIMDINLISNCIKVVQVNLQHSHSASCQLSRYAEEENIDILLLQEPYHYENKVKLLSNFKIIQCEDSNIPWAAIGIKKEKINFCKLSQFTTPIMATVEITLNGSKLFIIYILLKK